jgi:hypothetical protein
MKLNNTQRELLQRALLRRGHLSVHSKGERSAAAKLAAAGYLERVPGGSYLTGIRYTLTGY